MLICRLCCSRSTSYSAGCTCNRNYSGLCVENEDKKRQNGNKWYAIMVTEEALI